MSLVLAVLAVACTSGAGTDGTSTTQPRAEPTSTSQPPAEPTTTSTVPTTTTTISLPPHKESLEHGGDAWVVYLAVSSDFEDPALSEASLLASELGYPSGVGDLGCDFGGHQAVGFETGTVLSAVGVYFDTAVDAARFAVAIDDMGHDVAGLGLIQTYCMD